jgi:hypothetical protein
MAKKFDFGGGETYKSSRTTRRVSSSTQIAPGVSTTTSTVYSNSNKKGFAARTFAYFSSVSIIILSILGFIVGPYLLGDSTYDYEVEEFNYTEVSGFPTDGVNLAIPDYVGLGAPAVEGLENLFLFWSGIADIGAGLYNLLVFDAFTYNLPVYNYGSLEDLYLDFTYEVVSGRQTWIYIYQEPSFANLFTKRTIEAYFDIDGNIVYQEFVYYVSFIGNLVQTFNNETDFQNFLDEIEY